MVKKIYLVLGIAVVILVIFGAILIYNPLAVVRMFDPGNICDKLVSLGDIRRICGNTDVHDFENLSYYVSNAYYVNPGKSPSAALDEGETNRCFRQLASSTYFISGEEYYINGSQNNGLSISITTYNSTDLAAYRFIDARNNLDKGDVGLNQSLITLNSDTSEFGENGRIISYNAGDVRVMGYHSLPINYGVHIPKTNEILFLKGNKVIAIETDSYKQEIASVCDLDKLKALALVISKKI